MRIQEEKSRLRVEALKKREEAVNQAHAGEKLCSCFFAHIKPGSFSSVALYSPHKGEIDVLPLAKALGQLGVDCYLPVIEVSPKNPTLQGGGVLTGMTFSPWQPGSELIPNKYGVLEPKKHLQTRAERDSIPDIIVVPCLMADVVGGRLGYGKGYYDKIIADMRGEANSSSSGSVLVHVNQVGRSEQRHYTVPLCVGVAYAFQIYDKDLPGEPHDQKLDILLTPERAYFPLGSNDE